MPRTSEYKEGHVKLRLTPDFARAVLAHLKMRKDSEALNKLQALLASAIKDYQNGAL